MDSVAPGEVPRTLVKHLAVERFPLRDVFLRVDERKNRAGNNRDIGAADDLEQAQGVLHLLVAPGVTGKHGDTQDVRFRRIDQGENGLHVGATGAGAVLIDDDLAFGLSRRDAGEQTAEQEGDKCAASPGARRNSS